MIDLLKKHTVLFTVIAATFLLMVASYLIIDHVVQEADKAGGYHELIVDTGKEVKQIIREIKEE